MERKADPSKILIGMLVIMLCMLSLAGCGANGSGSTTDKNSDVPAENNIDKNNANNNIYTEKANKDDTDGVQAGGWEYFESISLIGVPYSELSEKYDLTKTGNADGGKWFDVGGEEFGIAFDGGKLKAGDAECNTMYGDVKDIIGVKNDMTVDEAAELLGTDFELYGPPEPCIHGIRPADDGEYYHIYIVISSLDETITGDTRMSINKKDGTY